MHQIELVTFWATSSRMLADRCGRGQVDNQVEGARLLHRHIGTIGASQDAVDEIWAGPNQLHDGLSRWCGSPDARVAHLQA
jgi:hypothetical protein